MAGPDKAMLEAVHDFPGPYTVKAFGPHTQRFVDDVRDAAERTKSGDAPPEISARASSKGAHICVTVTVLVESADGVHELYAAVQQVEGLRMLL